MKKGRKVKNVEYSHDFLKSLKRLPDRVVRQAEKKEKLFREDPFSPQLKVHKLSGRERDVWAFWINYSYRIKFVFLHDKEVLFLDIGTHKIYK